MRVDNHHNLHSDHSSLNKFPENFIVLSDTHHNNLLTIAYKNLRLFLVVTVVTFGLGACGGGSVNAGGSPGINGEIIINASNDSPNLFATSSCVTGVASFSNASWYTSGSIKLYNNCSTSQDLTKLSISLTSQDTSSPPKSIAIATLNDWWVNGTAYTLNFVAGGGNTQVGSFAAANGVPVINPGQTLTYSGGMNLSEKPYDNKNAAASIVVTGGVSPQTGSVVLNIDTTNSGCTIGSCANLTIALANSLGANVANIAIPSANLNALYTATINNLPIGNYTVIASVVNGINISYNPSASVVVSANSSTISNITYAKRVVENGQVTIAVPQVLAAYPGNLLAKIINTANNNQVVASFSVAEGNSVTSQNLPISDSTHAYALVVQGVADPVSGVYYAQNGVQNFVISAGKTTLISANLLKLNANLLPITLSINGLTASDSATIAFADSVGKFAYVDSKMIKNGNHVYYFEKGSVVAASVVASGGNYQSKTIVSNFSVTDSLVVIVTFSLPSAIVSNGVINFHYYYGASPTEPQDSLTLTGDNYTDLIMSNYIAGVMYGHLIKKVTPLIQFDEDYLYGSIWAQLLQENQSTQLYNKNNNYIADLSLVGINQDLGVMGVGQGGAYQINNYAVDMVNGSYEPAGFSLINYAAIQKNIGYTVASAAAQHTKATPVSFNNKYYGPMLTTYFHFNDYKALMFIGGANLTTPWSPGSYGWTPIWQPYFYNMLLKFETVPDSFLDIVLNVAYNQGFYGPLLLNYSKLGATATSATVASANSYSMAWGGNSYQQYPYQVHSYLDQLYNNSTPSTSNLNVLVSYNNHLAFNIAKLQEVFASVFQTLAYVNANGQYVYISAQAANAAFNSALTNLGIASNATLDFSDSSQRAKIFTLLENAINILENNLHTDFSATTLKQL